jgi:hypothetical protein
MRSATPFVSLFLVLAPVAIAAQGPCLPPQKPADDRTLNYLRRLVVLAEPHDTMWHRLLRLTQIDSLEVRPLRDPTLCRRLGKGMDRHDGSGADKRSIYVYRVGVDRFAAEDPAGDNKQGAWRVWFFDARGTFIEKVCLGCG